MDEDKAIKSQLVAAGVLHPLPKYDNCYLARTDPKENKQQAEHVLLNFQK